MNATRNFIRFTHKNLINTQSILIKIIYSDDLVKCHQIWYVITHIWYDSRIDFLYLQNVSLDNSFVKINANSPRLEPPIRAGRLQWWHTTKRNNFIVPKQTLILQQKINVQNNIYANYIHACILQLHTLLHTTYMLQWWHTSLPRWDDTLPQPRSTPLPSVSERVCGDHTGASLFWSPDFKFASNMFFVSWYIF